MKIEKNIEKIGNNLPTGVKKAAISGAFIATILTACGRTVDNTPVTTPAPTTTIEHQVDNNDVVDIPVVDDGQNVEPTTSTGGDSAIDNPTFVLTGENEYTVYVDCADNSNAPELDVLPSNDSMYTLPSSAENYGVSENLINAVLTHGMQVDPNNMLQINYDAYFDRTLEVNFYISGNFPLVFTNTPSAYDENEVLVYTPERLNGGDSDSEMANIRLCGMLLENALKNTNGNITCALMWYKDPDAWNQAMGECTSAAGLTAEEIYAGYDAAFVLSYDTLGLCDSNYVNDVLQYIGNDPITFTNIDENGEYGETTTYIVDRAKAYGPYGQK